uniref:Uncharacterized protein n=1 Tax=Candidatus Kentrum sp. SD TaxID=2126332 RepID=A0A451BN45_9GAMM|nr:MAG: hypothetical protein BECKSD772D_GA0070982_106018 [Candidatus Kentron sp. SD]
MHGKNSSALSMLEKIPRNVTADSDIVTTDSEKIEKSVTINRNERSRCVGIRSFCSPNTFRYSTGITFTNFGRYSSQLSRINWPRALPV